MQLVYRIRGSLGVSILIMLSLFGTLSYADTTKGGGSVTGSSVVSPMVGPSAPVAARDVDSKHMSSASVEVEGAAALRTAPTMPTQVLVGGLTLLPYVAAGFGGGYVTERDRALHTIPSASSLPNSATAGLRNIFGPHLLPNEVHLGLRVPF